MSLPCKYFLTTHDMGRGAIRTAGSDAEPQRAAALLIELRAQIL